MDKYRSDVFYDIQRLTLKRKIDLLKETKELCTHWWVDTLDGTSIQRKTINMGFEEALEKAKGNTLFVFIHRRGFSNWEWYLEVGYRTMTDPDYFLWINVAEKEIERLVKKYKLKLLT